MNNYLTSIAARTLNPSRSVRPRLGGRFEPASLAEGPIDNVNSSRRSAVKHSQLEPQEIGAIETADERDFNSQPLKTFDPPQLDRPAVITPEANSAATTAPVFTGSVVEPSPSLTIRVPNQPTAAETPKQNIPFELRPGEKVAEAAERGESRSPQPTEARTQNVPEPRLEESPGRSSRYHQQTAEVEPTPPPPSSPTIKPSSSADDEQEPVARAAITRKQIVERELETIVIRETAIRDESPLHQSSANSPPTPVAESPDTIETRASKTPPVVVHSRIAPLTEMEPKHLQLSHPVIPPQPTIHVTIGRIEVRAVQSSQSPNKSRAATPVMNLDDYLKRRSQGAGR